MDETLRLVHAFQYTDKHGEGQFLLGTDELLGKGSSFSEQISFKHDGQFLFGTEEFPMKGSSFREQMSSS